MKNESAPGPDGIPHGAYSVRGDWDRSSFETLASILWKEVPFQNISLKVGRSLSPRLTGMTMEGSFHLRTLFAR